MSVRILGLDPGLATFGAAVLDVRGGERAFCMGADVFTSQPRARKLNSLLADDRVRRTAELVVWLNDQIRTAQPDVIAAEAMSFPRGAHVIVAISLAWGVLTTLAEMWRLPMVTSSPIGWRKDLTPSGNEEDAHRVALRAVPSFADRVRRIDRKHQVHAYDALGVAYWSRRTNLVRALVARAA